MKKYSKYIVLLLICFMSKNIWAQGMSQEPHQYIADKLGFRYYANPTTVATANAIDNSAVRSGTETGTFWADGNMTFLHQLLRALLKPANNGGDATLQHYVVELLKINNKKILVHLWNDQAPLTSSSILASGKPCLSDSYVWPCASHYTSNANWGGYMHLGATHAVRYDNANTSDATKNGLKWLKDTFLHELMHTQDKTLQLGNSFIVLGQQYRYGADDEHYGIEIIPNQRLAYMEAIANVAPMYYNFKSFEDSFRKFVNNGYLAVEVTAPSNWVRRLNQLFGLGYNNNVWMYDQIRNHPNNVGNGAASRDPNYRLYRVQNLPAEFIVHNEMIMAMMFTMTSMHIADIDPFISATKTFNVQITANQNKDPFALLTEILANKLLLNGETIAHVKQELSDRNYSISPSDDVPYAFILPLAYSDYFTAYASTTKTQFKALFNNEMNTDLIDIYWDYFRTRVRTNVPIRSGRTWSDMTSIAMQCGVNQSYMPGTSGRRYEND
jgi:hypothetical protein